MEGTDRWFRTRATPLRDESGRHIAWLGTAIDIEGHRRALEDVQQLYEREHRIASQLQAAFLPPFLPEINGMRFDAVYRAAISRAEIGGDWYDVFSMGEGRVAFSVGDVTGHGFEAAHAMIRVRETIRAAAATLGPQPAAVLAFANRALCASNGGALATAFFAVYEPSARALRYSSAGHPAPVLRRGDVTRFIDAGGTLLGVEQDLEFPAHELVLEPQDALAIYTDGLIEGGRDIIGAEQRLLRSFAAGTAEASRIVESVLTEGQHDDVVLLTMEVVAPVASFDATSTGWRFHCDDSESAQPARQSFTAYLERRGALRETLTCAELIFGELVANVVRHAPGPIDVDLTWDASGPVLTVLDRGPGLARHDPVLPSDVFSESGRGLYLVSSLAGGTQICPRRGGGTEVRVVLPLLARSSPSHAAENT